MVKHNALKGFYELERTIGCGGFAKVKLATHLATGEKVAIKIMNKVLLKENLPRFKMEFGAMKALMHEHICKLYQVIETETHLYLVVEYCSGGELFDHIVEKNRLSESKSRLFFRQIVSAVAYLHSLGYTHRDIKPENVLLDHAQNLKLIDFGLCARPEGGMNSPLFTSCGSPTYAAPELVLGKQYLGPEVDVWAMGVLLYALLAGFLPFDDQNIDSLYKKILSGKYEEPSFMSQSSKRIIRQMLQVDPKQRITIKELLSHPWLTLGVLKPIQLSPDNNKTRDEDIVSLMAQYHTSPKEDMWRYLKRWKYDYDTATYLLLLARKNRGLPLQILPGATKLPIRVKSADSIRITTEPKPSLPRPVSANLNRHQKQELPVTPQPASKLRKPGSISIAVQSPRTPVLKLSNVNTPTKQLDVYTSSTPKTSDLLSPRNFVEPRRPSSIRKPLKRIRSPNLDGECSPVPTKKTPGYSTPRSSDKKHTPVTNETSSNSARKMLEKSLHKVRCVFTPKRPAQGINPIVLANKDLCNVSTTQCTDPEFVITELAKALQTKGIPCERKGFTLRGKMDPNVFHRYGGCSFELEICYLPTLGSEPSQSGNTPTKLLKSDNGTPISRIPRRNGASTNSGDFTIQKVTHDKKVGIRRKRLKGDSWCYKKVCEQVLALTATELIQNENAI